MKQIVKENKDLVKDTTTHAVINVNSSKLLNAKMAKKARMAQVNMLNTVVDRISSIEKTLEILLNKMEEK